MTRETKTAGNDRMGVWMLLAVVVITAILFFWTSNHYQHDKPGPATYVDQNGRLHVLGITLGETTLRQAETILQSRSDVALYIYPAEHPKAGMKMEAFFPAIADHTKVVLLLDMDQATLRDIETRATVPHLYPNEVARMNLAPADSSDAYNRVIRELTLIPNLNLSAAALQARFGNPDRIDPSDPEGTQYIFSAIGLNAVISSEGMPTLHFQNPPQPTTLSAPQS
ncbi:hypothetical protein FE236_05460 [Mariprofundus erugo]|uniref:hypothetical protein n=1 Tax=Mariprofundus erugo TaxID=2528639 RepID=UPI0010FF0653|nr:hypothetical protein [Mariprofundus erugo]TLS76898.1 hypothetical protein FE236_05460 [Mariprofundus erugo]